MLQNTLSAEEENDSAQELFVLSKVLGRKNAGYLLDYVSLSDRRLSQPEGDDSCD